MLPAIRARPFRAVSLRAVAVPRGLVLAGLLGAYLLGHFGLRLLEGDSLRWDEAEQTLFTQRLAWGYNDQPPVYTWLLRVVFRVTGVSVAGVYLLKLLMLGSVYAGVYAVASRLAPRPYAALAPLALLLTPYFGWSALIDGAHTVFVSAVVPVAALATYRVLDRPTTPGYLLLGLLLALGVLAKYSFVLLAAALVLALLTMPAYRARLRDPRLLLTLAVAGVMCLPHGLWVMEHWELVRTRPMVRGGLTADAPFARRVASGLGSLAETAVLTLGPLLAVVTACFGRGIRPLGTTPAGSDAVRLLGRWLAVLAGLLLVLVLVGVTRFRTHWLIPAAVLLPAYLFARLAEVPAVGGRRVFLAVAVAAGLAVVGARVVGIATESGNGGKLWSQNQMHPALADRVAAAGLDRGLIVGDHPITCANLRRRFPYARVVCVYYPAFDPARPPAPGPVGTVWDASYQYDLPPAVWTWLEGHGLLDRRRARQAVFVDAPGDPGNGPRRLGLARLTP